MTPEQKAALKARAKKAKEKYETLSPEEKAAMKERLKEKKQ